MIPYEDSAKKTMENAINARLMRLRIGITHVNVMKTMWLSILGFASANLAGMERHVIYYASKER